MQNTKFDIDKTIKKFNNAERGFVVKPQITSLPKIINLSHHPVQAH